LERGAGARLDVEGVVLLAADLLAARLAEPGAFLGSCPLHRPDDTSLGAGCARWRGSHSAEVHFSVKARRVRCEPCCEVSEVHSNGL
jgi:hypothetical protein